MFYSHSMLSRKGPLATIWLAAYCYHKLKKHQIATTDIAASVDKIIPEIELSYRIVAHLLLGVVRIFSRKVDFLYDDCNEALSRVQRSMVESLRRETLRTHTAATAGAGAVVAVVLKEAAATPRHAKKTSKAYTPPATPEAIPAADAREAGRAKRRKLLLLPSGEGGTSSGSSPERLSTPEGPMIAPYREGTITIPRTLELASFNLDIPEERDDDHNHHLLVLEDEDQEAYRRSAYLIQNHRPAALPDLSFDYARFTPLADSVLQDVINVDFELNESADRAHTWDGDLSLVPVADVEGGGCTAFPRARKSLSLTIDTDVYNTLQQSDDVIKVPPMTEHPEAKPSKPSTSGPTSPQFTVATPAKVEGHHFLGKRKRQIPFDIEAIVLSNEILRKGLDGTSDIVEKRGQAPHTCLDIWKTNKFSDLDKTFAEPLIFCNYTEIKDTQIRRSIRASSSKTTALNSKILSSSASQSKNVHKSAKRKSLATTVEQRETAKRKSSSAAAVGRPTVAMSDHVLPDKPSDFPPETGGETLGNASAGVHVDDIAGISAETRVAEEIDAAAEMLEKTDDGAAPLEPSTDNRLFGTSGETMADVGTLGGILVETFVDKRMEETRADEEPSEAMSSDEETSTENGSSSESFSQSGLSARTRLVAKNLHKAFRNSRFREQGGDLSLTKILDGKKRGACARFFYETLVLTTRGCLEVKQETPYSDIIILASSEWTLRPIVAPAT